jgi:predicted PurR-regulated permease PerM
MPKRVDDSELADDRIARAVPIAVRIVGAWAWPMVGILILGALVIYLVILLHVVVIPVLVAVLITGLINPIKLWLIAHRWPKGLAVVATFLTLLIVLAALITLVTLTVRSGLGDIQSRTESAYKSLLSALSNGPLGISSSDVQSGLDSATKWVQSNASTLLSGALTGASTVGDIGVGLVLSLFLTLFFLIDGSGVWRWLTRLAPKRGRAAVDGAGRAAWISVGQYVRVQIIVALIDAIGIGLGALILGLPFVVPIAVLVFLAAFIPFVGAIVTGGLAVLIALVYAGPVPAVIMLAVVIGVNQLESHILQPLLMGTAVRLHPVAVVLAVSSGSIIGGIGGAVFAVPLAAAANSGIKYIAGGAWKDDAPPPSDPMPREPEQGGAPARRRRRRAADPEDVTTVA